MKIKRHPDAKFYYQGEWKRWLIAIVWYAAIGYVGCWSVVIGSVLALLILRFLIHPFLP